MMNNRKRNLLFIAFSILCTLVFVYPYLVKDFLPLEHDTLFHLSRIEGLAQSFKDGEFIARIYPYKNMSFGYASPLFYSDFFLIIPALLYNFGMSIVTCYKLILLITTFLSCFFAMKLVSKISLNEFAPYLGGVLYLFNNYRITDVYVRGALGEVMGFIFLPLVLLGIYYLLYDDETKWHYLVFGFGGLALTHNITFVLACILFLFFIILRFKFLLQNKNRIKSILYAVLITFLLTAFFTLPMLEQLKSQDFYLNYYTSSSSMTSYTLPLWKYFTNTTVFGYGSNDMSKELSMILNIGYFLMFVPLLYLLKKKKDQPFVLHCLIIGYILLLLPINLLPWNYFFMFSLIQFPWRLLMISSLCLIIPASIAPFQFNWNKKIIALSCIGILLLEGIWHILPVMNRTSGITSKTEYSQLIDGSMIDPFYSATYVRVELAGADYLPSGSPDYRYITTEVTDENQVPVHSIQTRKGTTLTIDNLEPNRTYILPVTYYKGYQVYSVNNETNKLEKIKTYQAPNTLVGFDGNNSSSYVLKYVPTFIQTSSLFISIFTLFVIIVIKLKKSLHK